MRAVRRRRSRGQSLVETALLMPFLLILLLGAAQIGVIAYGNVTMDTAAREGARIASERPGNAANFNGTTITYTGCLAADQAANYVVQSVCRNAGPAGIIDTSRISVTIIKDVSITSRRTDPSIRYAGVPAPAPTPSPCPNGGKNVTGTVNGIPTGQTAVLQTTKDTTYFLSIPGPSPAGYSACLPSGTQTVSVKVGSGCTGYSASVDMNPSNTSSQDFTLTANPTCAPTIATTTTVSANPTSISSGASTTLTATVTAASGGTPTGSVTFTDASNGNNVLGTVTLTAAGQAALSTTGLTAAGNHQINATYNPDPTHSGSSGSVTVFVTAPGTPTTTTLSVSPTGSVTQGTTVTLNATVVGAGTTPTGSVTFTSTNNGVTTTLGTVTLTAAGTASLPTAALPAGTNGITATYSGDATNAASSGGASVTVIPPGTPTPSLPPPFACTDPPTVVDGPLTSMYMEIDVSYPVPIFVPFVGGIFSTSSGTRMVTIKQVIHIDPCGATIPFDN